VIFVQRVRHTCSSPEANFLPRVCGAKQAFFRMHETTTAPRRLIFARKYAVTPHDGVADGSKFRNLAEESAGRDFVSVEGVLAIKPPDMSIFHSSGGLIREPLKSPH